jgi:hypothetical protein
VTPDERLLAVDALLNIGAAAGGPAGARGAPVLAASAGRTVHTRAAAFLLRRALEDRLNACLRDHRPVLLRCSTRTQIAWLAQHAGPAVAGRYAATWHSLSLACHYHRSALPPTPAQLRGWRDEVAAVLSGFTHRAVRVPAPRHGTGANHHL